MLVLEFLLGTAVAWLVAILGGFGFSGPNTLGGPSERAESPAQPSQSPPTRTYPKVSLLHPEPGFLLVF